VAGQFRAASVDFAEKTKKSKRELAKQIIGFRAETKKGIYCRSFIPKTAPALPPAAEKTLSVAAILLTII
jgi:hypothetical protein